MPESVADLVTKWDLGGLQTTRKEAFNDLHAKLQFFHRHFAQYLPALGPDSIDYEGRLELWLENVASDEQKRTLLELAADILFFTREDFLKLHQSALTGPIKRWIIEQMNLDLASPDLSATIDAEIHDHTWFCALTDSMPIADFYHANNLTGTTHRPDCRSLARFGDLAEIERFMATHTVQKNAKPLRRIVVLEDFVGSGVQMSETERVVPTPTGNIKMTVFDFLAALPSKPPILFVPLMICPEGTKVAADAVARLAGRLTVDPVLQLGPGEFINGATNAAPESLEAKVKAIAHLTYLQVQGDKSSHPRPYTPYGFNNTGARVVMYSNTPANSLALIHHWSNTWQPLFRRSARVR